MLEDQQATTTIPPYQQIIPVPRLAEGIVKPQIPSQVVV
jgi:hypothetical protein